MEFDFAFLGAANQTEKHLLAAMHLQSVPCLHHALGTLRRRFTESTLSLASRLYLQKGESWHGGGG